MNKTYAIPEFLVRHARRLGAATLFYGLVLGNANAQTANLYSFTTSTGGALRDMSGSTVLVAQGGFNSAVTSIGFSFIYEGTAYTQFSANNYGGIRLGGTVIQDFQVQNLYGNPPVILPFSVDGDQAASSASYKVEGTAPDRILTVQWVHQNYSWDGGQLCTFQASLFEGTNAIEFRYGSGGITSPWKNFLAIGGATSTNFLNILSNHTVSNTNDLSADAWPGTGRVYNFAPPAPCVTPTPGNTLATVSSGCSGYTSALSMQNPTIGSGVSYQWQSSPNGVDTWTNVGTNIPTHQTPALTITTWFRCQVTCSTGPDVVSSTPIQLLVSEPAATYFTYAGAQYNEAFASWGNRCSTGDVPTAASNHWKNSPAFGPGTWRASNASQVSSGWNNTSGGFFSTTVATNPDAVAVTLPAARFHSRQGSSVVGTLDFHINMSAATGNETLRFEYINSAGNGNMSVWVSTNGGTNFTQVGSTLTSTPLNTWETKQFTIGSTSANTVIRLRGTAGAAATGNDIGVDNFRIIPAAACPAPTAPIASVVDAGAVNLSWTCASCTGTYVVEYGLSGFALGTGTVVSSITGTSTSITGLANGNYQAYVRRNCGVDGFSSNAGPMSFSIVAGDFCASAINFAGSTAGDTPISPSATTANATNTYGTTACSVSAPGPDVLLYHDVAAGATLSFTVQNIGGGGMVLRYGGACPGDVQLGCGTSYFTTAPLADANGQVTWMNTTCTTQRVYMQVEGAGAGGPVYIWNYSYVTGAAPCNAVSNIASAVTGNTTASVSWDATCSGNVIVEYGATGFTPGTGGSAGGGTVVPVSGTSTVLNGLDMDVIYDVYVRNACSAGVYSTNGTPVQFTIINGDDCTRVIDLSTETSPYFGSTTGTNNDISVHGCGTFNGGDVILSYPVGAGSTIQFFAAHDYAANVSILYGTTCPGSTELACEADLSEFTWTNNTGTTRTVYWIQDGTTTGDFNLEWSIEGPCALGQQGEPCYAGPLFNSGIVNGDCECEGQDPVACSNALTLEFQTDGNPAQTTWELVEPGTNYVVQ
ncbi:MAG: hypothetical protein JNM62_07895, partial [Flavobacteriales bacterium]|nr:hypothetical protein [Flavobacteriales bacterium]